MALMPVSMDIAVNVIVFLSDFEPSIGDEEEESWSQESLESTPQDEADKKMLIFSECDSQFDLLETAIRSWTLRLLSPTEDFIVLKEPVELVQLFFSIEGDLDNLVDWEECNGKDEDDVGVEGDELMNCILSSSIFAVVGAVPYHPPGLEAWVLGVGAGVNIPVSCRIVNISVFLSTKVLLAII